MSEEQATVEHEGELPQPKVPQPENDGTVEAQFSVAVVPNDTVSIHYVVSPVEEADAVTSVTASFVKTTDGAISHSFGGSTSEDLISPRDGQGATGNVGVDASVFSGEHEGQLEAILAGTVRHGEETLNFFFKKPFDPTV